MCTFSMQVRLTRRSRFVFDTLHTYWNYLQKCFTWTQADLMAIQWDTLKTALNLFLHNDQYHLVLFIHDKLALWMSKFHPHLGSQLCPSCLRDPEDVWHFLECQHMEWHHLFSTLKQTLTVIPTNIPSILPSSLHFGWDYWCSKMIPHIPRSTMTSCVSYVPFLRPRPGYHGQVSHLWEMAINQLNLHLNISSHSIATQMVKAVWTYILAVWTLQNQHLH